MPYQLSRIGRTLVAQRQADGTTITVYIDDLPLEEVVAIAMEREVANIRAITDKYEPFLRAGVSASETLSDIAAAMRIIGPPPVRPKVGDDEDDELTLKANIWLWLRELACSHGWYPQGTKDPLYWPPSMWETWDGSYERIFAQTVSYEDVANMVKALKTALAKEDFGTPFCPDFGDVSSDILAGFIQFCDGGYSVTIW